MKKTILLCHIFFFTLLLNGQVTVGSDESPERGMILEVKTQPADANNVTSDKGGLLLPRVALYGRSSLVPFIQDADVTAQDKIKHTGLMVYNIDNEDGLRPGIHIWDGTQWKAAGGGIAYFYPPAFNLPLDITTTNQINTFDLYKAYEDQFDKLKNTTHWRSTDPTMASVPSPYNGTLFRRDELYYVVVHYDTGIIEDVSIYNDPNETDPDKLMGTLKYKVVNDDPDSSSFINLVFIPK